MNNKNSKANKYLDVFSYKIFKCKVKNCKLNYKCLNYHNKLDKRRRLFKNCNYYPKKCDCTFLKIYENKNCNCINKCKCSSTNCEYSHNIFEILYHPLKYKTQFCNNINKCKFGKFCCNAHSLEEINLELIHNYKFNYTFFIFKFKTEFCPIIKNHLKKTCVYAHNFQEYRRKPNNWNENKECNNWKIDNKIPNIYTEKCSQYCNEFHGWKEFDYHPKNYKVIQCKEEKYENCKHKFLCPRYHIKKIDYFENKKNYFKIVPKNINSKL